MKYLLISLAMLLASAITLCAQDFVYQPQNPAFGGSYLNYSWMLSSAQAQNGFTDSNGAGSSFDRDPLEDFEESLNRQILSRISRELISDQFGEEGLEEGIYEIGSYKINVSPGDEGIQIRILDTTTGSETTVTAPYF
uniref:Curli production assembly/transport component CsgF n=1 Tax=Roseihalotalea indica TaxID=2867963 RepID=A0AA49JAZ1_9BACT|nr:curli assembly protein CsgF [Tunicatimonas sp. TK19036]